MQAFFIFNLSEVGIISDTNTPHNAFFEIACVGFDIFSFSEA